MDEVAPGVDSILHVGAPARDPGWSVRMLVWQRVFLKYIYALAPLLWVTHWTGTSGSTRLTLATVLHVLYYQVSCAEGRSPADLDSTLTWPT